MSQITLLVTDEVISKAFDGVKIPSIPASFREQGLNAPAADPFKTAFEEAWRRVKKLAETAWLMGWEAIKPEVKAVSTYITELAEELGDLGSDFLTAIAREIRGTVTRLFEMMLGSVQQRIKVGEVTFSLKSVVLEQKLVSTGSLELSLHTLCKAAAQGELVVKGSYEV